MNPTNYNSQYSPRKVVIGRHWKRPKPRVYECNARDVERFYQESYKDYLDAKDFAKQRSSVDRDRNLDRIASNFVPEYRRTDRSESYLESLRNPETYLQRDSNVDLPPLNRGGSTSSYTRQYSFGNETTTTDIPTFRASSMTNQREMSSEREMENINERLSRLKKLREEIGLPSGTSKDASSFSTTASTSQSRIKQISPMRDTRQARGNYMEESDTNTSFRSSGRRFGAADSSLGGSSDHYSTKTESKYSSISSNADDASGKQNGASYSTAFEKKSSTSFTDDVNDSLGKRSRNKVHFGAGEDSDFKYTPPATTSRKFESKTGASATSSTLNGSVDIDDDEILNIRKKFPTSDEIMERIKKMEVDL